MRNMEGGGGVGMFVVPIRFRVAGIWCVFVACPGKVCGVVVVPYDPKLLYSDSNLFVSKTGGADPKQSRCDLAKLAQRNKN